MGVAGAFGRHESMVPRFGFCERPVADQHPEPWVLLRDGQHLVWHGVSRRRRVLAVNSAESDRRSERETAGGMAAGGVINDCLRTHVDNTGHRHSPTT